MQHVHDRQKGNTKINIYRLQKQGNSEDKLVKLKFSSINLW